MPLLMLLLLLRRPFPTSLVRQTFSGLMMHFYLKPSTTSMPCITAVVVPQHFVILMYVWNYLLGCAPQGRRRGSYFLVSLMCILIPSTKQSPVVLVEGMNRVVSLLSNESMQFLKTPNEPGMVAHI